MQNALRSLERIARDSRVERFDSMRPSDVSSGPALWMAEVRALRSDSPARRRARIEAAARAACCGVHVTSDGAGGATLCGASHVELASTAAEHGLLYGVAPIGPRQLSASEPWADYFLVEAREPVTRDLALELGRTGKPVWVRLEVDDVPRGLLAIDALIEAGSRRLVAVCATSRHAVDVGTAGIDTVRRETGLCVGWSESGADGARLLRAHRAFGARHLIARLELEGEAATGHSFEPSELARVRHQAAARVLAAW